MADSLRYRCINCGSDVPQLYKKYTSVLKLTSCENCNEIVDKYIEYDPVIVVIDLILLYREAYRHILFNTAFTNHWKLACLVILMESYKEWSVRDKTENKIVQLDQFDTGDLSFYIIFLYVIIRTCCYILLIFTFTVAYNFFAKRRKSVRNIWMEIWKCITLSSFGLFMYIPCIIWEGSINDYADLSISLYVTLSQLLAYTVTCDCSKPWSIIVITASFVIESILFPSGYYKAEVPCQNTTCAI